MSNSRASERAKTRWVFEIIYFSINIRRNEAFRRNLVFISRARLDKLIKQTLKPRAYLKKKYNKANSKVYIRSTHYNMNK